MKFPRIIRLDDADRRAFASAAAAGEWAVTGAFRFAHRDPATFHQRELKVLQHGWLGLDSFGSASLVEVAETTEDNYDSLMRRLAAYFLANCGVSDVRDAVEAAEQEMAFAVSLCGHPLKTILALDREFNEQGLIETTRIIF
jgi:Family of unknown function (DUF6505)